MSDDGSEIPPPLTLDQVQKLVSEAISAEREAIDARFVEQEHRGARVLVNWYDGIRSGKPTLKRSAWLALLWNFLLPRPTTVALAAGGLATLAVTALGVAMAYRANLLLERQNVRLDVQNLLAEAQRRTTFLASELAIITPLIVNEKAASEAANSPVPFVLSPALASRVAALAAGLKPYRVVEIPQFTVPKQVTAGGQKPSSGVAQHLRDFFEIDPDDGLFFIPDTAQSPERGQLLLNLLSHNVDLTKIPNLDLNHAFLSGVTIENADLTGAALNFAAFHGVRIVKTKLRGTGLNYASFLGTKFIDSEIDAPTLAGTKFQNVALTRTALRIMVGIADKATICTAKAIVFDEADMRTAETITELNKCDASDFLVVIRDSQVAMSIKEGLPTGFRICSSPPAGPAVIATIARTGQPCGEGSTLVVEK